jgi:CheY-like chemotaxis protein
MSEPKMDPETTQILIIDNDAGRRRLSQRVLGEEGFAVTAVADGFSAIRAAGSRRFALALAAVELPGTLDGAITIRQLRARQPWLKALYTADAGERLHCPVRDCGDVVPWPSPRSELLGCVFEMLQRATVVGVDAAGSGRAAYRRRGCSGTGDHASASSID